MTAKRRTLFAVGVLAGCVSIGAFAVQAQDSSNQKDTSGQKMDSGSGKMMKSPDTTFAMKAAQGGMAEVQMGKLAAERAGSADVKAFGQQMVDDHSKANDDLKSVAEKEGMTLPADMNAHQHAMYSRLEKLSGAAFDRAYVRDMVMDHQEDVKEFQKETNSGKDDQIKAFASRTLPVIQGHLDKIKSIQSNMQSGSSGK
jgi:putative membrane protein